VSTSSIEEAVRLAVENRSRRLPPEDEAAVQGLIVAYGLAADFGHADAVADLFTDDATWDGSNFRFPRCDGRDEIRAWFGKLAAEGKRQVHVMEPALLWADGPDRAHGVVSFNAMEVDPDGHGVFAAQHAYGLYEDQYVKHAGAWRLAQRSLHLRLVRR
jgi:ketosteroid isomerase-like protein